MATRLAICTTVFGGNLADPNRGPVNAVRLALALEGAEAAARRQVPLVVVVGDEGERGSMLRDDFRRLDAVTVEQERLSEAEQASEFRRSGMFISRQQALRVGRNLCPQVLLWCEPEKVSEIMRDRNWYRLSKAVDLVRERIVDGITPACWEMNGYPELQRQSEQEADEEIAKITGLSRYDAYRGPFGGNQKVIDCMLSYGGEYGDMHQTTCVLQQLRCLAAGLDIGIFRLPEFRYPFIQGLVEDGNKEIEGIRKVQRGLVDSVRDFVESQNAMVAWPPPGKFKNLGSVWKELAD